MKQLIEITEQHIKDARKLIEFRALPNEDACPVALSLHDAGFPKAIVCEEAIQIDGSTNTRLADISERVKEFIRGFDSGREVKPLKFVLNIGVERR